jgi:hypothetical protein
MIKTTRRALAVAAVWMLLVATASAARALKDDTLSGDINAGAVFPRLPREPLGWGLAGEPLGWNPRAVSVVPCWYRGGTTLLPGPGAPVVGARCCQDRSHELSACLPHTGTAGCPAPAGPV